MKPYAYFGLVVATCLFGSCQVSKKTTIKEDTTPIVTVGNQPVSIDEFRYLYEKNNQNDSTAYTEANVREYIQLYTKFKLKVLEARRLGLDTAQDFKAELSDYRKQLAKPYLTDNEFTEKLIQEAYTRLGEEIRASHILILAPKAASPTDSLKAFQKINEVRQKAVAGEDFNALAKQYSEDPSAAQNGGDLGYFTALQMVYQFEDMAYKTGKGQVSPVFRTRFGYHILKVADRRKSSGSVRIAHILINASEGISKDDSLAASKRIFEIHDKLKKGEDWATLCKQFSEDAKTKEKEGELRWFSAGTLTTELNEAAFLLQKAGDYSAPVKSPFGWHIIKLLEKKELEPFEALKNTLKQKVSKDSRSELNRNYLISKLKKQYDFKEQKKAKQIVQLWADSTVLKSNWAYNRQAKQLNTPLFSIAQNTYNLVQFGDFLEKQNKPKEPVSPQLYVAQQYEEFMNKTIFDYHDSNLEENMPEFRYLFNEYYEGMLMFKIMEQNVWTKALTDTAGLQQYFTQHQDKYRWKERAKAVLYNCDSQETLQTVQQELQKDWFVNQAVAFTPTSFLPNKTELDSTTKATLSRVADYLRREKETLIELQVFSRKGEKNDINAKRLAAMKEYLNKQEGIGAERIADKNLGQDDAAKLGGVKYIVYTKSPKTLIYSLTRLRPLAVQMIEGTFQRGDNAAMDAIGEWKVGKSSLQKDGRYYFVAIEEVMPASPKKLAETKGSVVSDYQAHLETEWLKYLTEKYPVKMHEETIKKFLQQ